MTSSEQAAAELLSGIRALPRRSWIWWSGPRRWKWNSRRRSSTGAATILTARVRDLFSSLPESSGLEIIELGLKHRGKHDEALRAFHAGAALRFDILMDIGGFRDMHRHRRVTQIKQGFTAKHGYETPHSGDVAGLEEAGILADYQGAVELSHAASAKVAAGSAPETALSALYLLPLATRVRCLFKMDFAEAQYISELRSAAAGHFSYRRVAWEMYLALERQHPSLAKYIRATDFTEPIDLLQR